MILNEFDSDKEAILNPCDIVSRIKCENFPKIAVTCFDKKIFNYLVDELDANIIAKLSNANEKFQIYGAEYKNVNIALYMSDVGAPSAAAFLEEIYALGVETVIMFGSCGVLDGSIEDSQIIIPSSAIRDEGLSYHYIPAADEIEVNSKYVSEFINLIEETNMKYTIGKVWTTDAIYRETREKMKRRKAQGCICVDMECSAMAAVAKFRNKEIFQFFYAEDNLDSDEWDRRSLGSDLGIDNKYVVAKLAVKLATRI